MPSKFVVALTHIAYFPGSSPCFIETSLLPMLYSTVQLGTRCAWPLTKRQAIGISLFPEVRIQKSSESRTTLQPAFLVGVTHNFSLSEETQRRTFFFNGNYKFVPSQPSSESISDFDAGFHAGLTQQWADIFESYWSLGAIFQTGTSPELADRGWQYRMRYRESIPLALRRIGALSQWAWVEWKAADLTTGYRGESGWGSLGLGLAWVTLDKTKLVVPFPLVNFGYDF